MNKHINVPEGAEEWLVNLIELKNRTEITVKQIAEKENLAEKSIFNVFYGKSKSPSVDLVRRIIHALGGKWSEIFAESGAVIGGQDLLKLKEDVAAITEEKSVLESQLNLVNLELSVLKEKINALESENKLLHLKLEHKEEIIALHDFYRKILKRED